MKNRQRRHKSLNLIRTHKEVRKALIRSAKRRQGGRYAW